eukprot:m.1298652 g.1298652  ORF g.1298652 m.1298652 type:complete len:976 (+) comp24798_c1_seq90:51-2978(+)
MFWFGNSLLPGALGVLSCVFLAIPVQFTSGVPTGLSPTKMVRWISINVEEYGAVGDNHTDNTISFRKAMSAVAAAGGGEVVVPPGKCFQTAPFNLSSNVVLRVEGTVRAIEDFHAFPIIPVLPSYGHDLDTNSNARRHPFIFAVGASNISIVGHGVIDGAGAYWWPHFYNHSIDPGVGRPHLVELNDCSGIEIADVTLLNSAFWTLHPIYCKDLYIHDIKLLSPWCQNYKCANTDGIDVDSTVNVLIENNYISCGDDHVTILSGAGEAGRTWNNGHGMPSKNITVRNNILGTGMGLSVGSSISGGIEDVLYVGNVMNETRGEWGQGAHLKTRVQYGGYVYNVAWVDNDFKVAGAPGGAIVIETGYQSGGECNASTCTDIRDIVFRNLTVHSGSPGGVNCYPARPCINVTFDNVHVNDTGTWSCTNVASGSATDVSPPGLGAACGFASAAPTARTTAGPVPAVVEMNETTPVAHVSKRFVAFTIDSSTWLHVDLEDAFLNALVAPFAGTLLRVGGTQGDYNIYTIGAMANMSCHTLPAPMTTYRCAEISAAQWTELLRFSARNNLSLAFGLSDMYGRPTKSKAADSDGLMGEKPQCNPTCPAHNMANIEALLAYTARSPYKDVLEVLELGNELNSCLNGEQGAKAQAEDFIALADLRNKYLPSARLYGPDAHSYTEFSSEGLEWFQHFADTGRDAVDAITFHMYILGQGPALNAKDLPASFLNATMLDRAKEGVLAIKKAVGDYGFADKLVAGETSSANEGGHEGITDTFINGFWYIDQLGSLAALNVSSFMRQTLLASKGYPLVENATGTLVPLPDYWVARLYHTLTTGTVLSVASANRNLRVYAHCAASRSPMGGGASADAGGGARAGVVLVYANLNLETGVAVTLPPALRAAKTREEFFLTAGDPIAGASMPLQSRQVKLNGKVLTGSVGHPLPPLTGVSVSNDVALVLPAASYGFLRFDDVALPACGAPSMV